MGGGISKAMRTRGLVVDQGFKTGKSYKVRTQEPPHNPTSRKLSDKAMGTYKNAGHPQATDMFGNKIA